MVLATLPLSPARGLFSWPKLDAVTYYSCIGSRRSIVISYPRRRALYNFRKSQSTNNNVRATSINSSASANPVPVTSDLILKRNGNALWDRDWSHEKMAMARGLVLVHLLCLFAPFAFNWAALRVAFGLYVVTGLFGITLSYHRNLTHRSFKLPKWLEYTFAYCGVLAGQMDPITWVSVHRFHHQYCDLERDPHSPNEGFWFSHIKWLFDPEYLKEKTGEETNVGDLKQQPFYSFLQETYFFHMLGIALPLYALGGFPFVVWGLGVRVVWVLHITLLVNSACHIWGFQSWKTTDRSRNNWWVALLAFGEGWHNNHHAFEFSARQGFEWWQVDMTWYVIKFLEALGLATDVKLPSNVQKQRMAI